MMVMVLSLALAIHMKRFSSFFYNENRSIKWEAILGIIKTSRKAKCNVHASTGLHGSSLRYFLEESLLRLLSFLLSCLVF